MSVSVTSTIMGRTESSQPVLSLYFKYTSVEHNQTTHYTRDIPLHQESFLVPFAQAINSYIMIL